MEVTAETCSSHQVECESGQRIARRLIGKTKDVKLPIVLSLLHCDKQEMQPLLGPFISAAESRFNKGQQSTLRLLHHVPSIGLKGSACAIARCRTGRHCDNGQFGCSHAAKHVHLMSCVLLSFNILKHLELSCTLCVYTTFSFQDLVTASTHFYRPVDCCECLPASISPQ